MAHMLASVNPAAAEEIMHPTPLPDIGETVVYIPRTGEVRAGKKRVPAIVMGRDLDNGLLDLVVIYDADDFLSVRRVPRHAGDDRGWELPEGRRATMFAVSANADDTRLRSIEVRIAALEFKRGPGRPPNPRPGEE